MAVGLKLSPPECKVMRPTTKGQDSLKIGYEEVDVVEEFVYLRATMCKDEGGTEDIRNKLSKARGAFNNLLKIWRLNSIGCNRQIKFFKTLVRPVLLYRCKVWKLKSEEMKPHSFKFTCLRRILGIRWP